MRPSGVRSNTAPTLRAPRTRSGASFALNLGPCASCLGTGRAGIVSAKCTFQCPVVVVRHGGGHAALGHHGVRLAEQ